MYEGVVSIIQITRVRQGDVDIGNGATGIILEVETETWNWVDGCVWLG